MSVYDVVTIGAGMAGGCLARPLSLEMPQLSVCLLDGKTDFDYRVGESTVEVAPPARRKPLRVQRIYRSLNTMELPVGQQFVYLALVHSTGSIWGYQ